MLRNLPGNSKRLALKNIDSLFVALMGLGRRSWSFTQPKLWMPYLATGLRNVNAQPQTKLGLRLEPLSSGGMLTFGHLIGTRIPAPAIGTRGNRKR